MNRISIIAVVDVVLAADGGMAPSYIIGTVRDNTRLIVRIRAAAVVSFGPVKSAVTCRKRCLGSEFIERESLKIHD